MSKKNVIGADDFPVMSGLFGQAGLKLVDVGGRGSAFPPYMLLAPVADLFVVEPDRVEAERLEQQLPGDVAWRTITVLREAIAASPGEAQLFLTSAPGMSSLLEPDRAVVGRYYLRGKFDIADTMTVPTLPLDDAAARYGFGDAAFLKLDTQGTELEILRSGARLLDDSLLGVHTESLFQPFYQGQSLFADVDVYLRDRGFTLFSLSRTSLRRFGFRETVYSKRIIAWAHCLYFREPETLLEADQARLLTRLSRLLALAFAFKHIDLAMDIIAILGRERLLPEADVERLSSEFDQAAQLVSREVVSKARRRGVQADVMAASYADRRLLE